mgnify:CR=1 FL=1
MVNLLAKHDESMIITDPKGEIYEKTANMLKTLGAQVKEFKKDSLLTPVFMVLEVFMEMLIPLLMASIIDDGVNVGNLKHIYITGGIMFIMACFSLSFGLLGGKYGARASTGFARNLRQAMYENIQSFSFANIDKFIILFHNFSIFDSKHCQFYNLTTSKIQTGSFSIKKYFHNSICAVGLIIFNLVLFKSSSFVYGTPATVLRYVSIISS